MNALENQPSLKMTVGAVKRLSAKAYPDSTVGLPTWTSSNLLIATVVTNVAGDADVTAISTGSVYIIADILGVQARILVEVVTTPDRVQITIV